MFNENMTYEEMDRILRDIGFPRNLSIIELVDIGDLSIEDIELFLSAYLKRFNLEKEDLNNVNKVGLIIFDLSSKLQSMKTAKIFY